MSSPENKAVCTVMLSSEDYARFQHELKIDAFKGDRYQTRHLGVYHTVFQNTGGSDQRNARVLIKSVHFEVVANLRSKRTPNLL